MNDTYIPLEQAGWPLIELGFGRNGSGKVGDPLTPDRQMLPGEPLAVVTFANVESLDVVLGKLQIIRERMTSGVAPTGGQSNG